MELSASFSVWLVLGYSYAHWLPSPSKIEVVRYKEKSIIVYITDDKVPRLVMSWLVFVLVFV